MPTLQTTDADARANRVVAAQLNKTRLCAKFSRGGCRSSKCRFAHSQLELREAPDLSRTAICQAFLEGACRDDLCKFAHCRQELRATNAVYKTQLCKYWEQRGSCTKGDECRHAHGEVQRRQLQPVTVTQVAVASDAAAACAAAQGAVGAELDAVEVNRAAASHWYHGKARPLPVAERTNRPDDASRPPPAVLLPCPLPAGIVTLPTSSAIATSASMPASTQIGSSRSSSSSQRSPPRPAPRFHHNPHHHAVASTAASTPTAAVRPCSESPSQAPSQASTSATTAQACLPWSDNSGGTLRARSQSPHQRPIAGNVASSVGATPSRFSRELLEQFEAALQLSEPSPLPSRPMSPAAAPALHPPWFVQAKHLFTQPQPQLPPTVSTSSYQSTTATDHLWYIQENINACLLAAGPLEMPPLQSTSTPSLAAHSLATPPMAAAPQPQFVSPLAALPASASPLPQSLPSVSSPLAGDRNESSVDKAVPPFPITSPVLWPRSPASWESAMQTGQRVGEQRSLTQLALNKSFAAYGRASEAQRDATRPDVGSGGGCGSAWQNMENEDAIDSRPGLWVI